MPSSPADLYGRAFGALQSMTVAFVPFVTAIGGFVIERPGVVLVCRASALRTWRVMFGTLLNPMLRRMDTRKMMTS